MRHDARLNRERILAAAEEVFGTQGAAGSTEEVARRAGVGIATVFRHFPTKNQLIEAVLIGHFTRLTDHARSLADTGSPGDALRALIREMIEAGPAKIALASLMPEKGQFTPDVAAASAGLRSAVDAVLNRARAAGQVRPGVTIDEVYLLIRGLAHASAAAPVSRETLRGAAGIVLAGMADTDAGVGDPER